MAASKPKSLAEILKAAAPGQRKEFDVEAARQLITSTKHRRNAVRLAYNKDEIVQWNRDVRRQATFKPLVVFAAKCFGSLAVNEVTTVELVEEGALDTLEHIMAVNPGKEEVNVSAIRAVSKMCLNEHTTALVSERFGAEPLLRAVANLEETETMVEASRLATRLMHSSEAVDRFVEGGAVTKLATMLQKKADDETDGVLAIAAGAESLARIADDPKHAEAIMASGAVEVVMAAMQAHPDQADLARFGVSLLGKLASSSPEIAERLKAMGAVDVVVGALEAHPDAADVLRYGADAMRAMTGTDDVGSALRVVQSGRVDHAAAAAMATVGSLALVDENVAYLVQHGGIPAVVAAMRNAAGDKGPVGMRMLESGCRTLARLAVSEANIYSIMKEGGVKAAVATLKEFRENERVAAAALAALAAVCTRKENATYLSKLGAVAAAVAALRQHPGSAAVARHAVALFKAMAAHEEQVPGLVAAGAIEALLDVMKHHAGDAELMADAVNALGRMAVSEEELRRIAESGGFEQLVDLLRRHGDDARLAEQVMLMLETAALVPDNVPLLREAGALDAILDTLQRHPDNEAIQEVGARALALFANEEQLAAIVGNVRELVEQYEAAATAAAQRDAAARLAPAAGLLAHLARAGNVEFLREAGAPAPVDRAVARAAALPETEERQQVLQAAARAAAALADSAPTSSALVSGGGLQRLLDASLSCPDDDDLAEHAAAAAETCASYPENVERMVADGTVRKLVALAEAHPHSQAVLASAARAVGRLAAGRPALAADIAREAGVAGMVLEAMSGVDVRGMVEALEALEALAADEAAAYELFRAGAMERAVEAMRRYPDSAEVQVAAMRALGAMAKNEELARAVGEKGGLGLVAAALRAHHTDEPLVETALVLLDALAAVPANADVLYNDEGADELVRWAAESYPDNAEIQAVAARFQETLERGLAGGGAGGADDAGAAAAAPEPMTAAALLERLQGHAALTSAEVVGAVQQLEALLRLDDPTEAHSFVARGGLEELGRVVRARRGDKAVEGAAARAYAAAGERECAAFPVSAEELSLASPETVAALVGMLRGELGDVSDEAMAAACEVLARLVEHEANVQALLSSGGVDELVRILGSSTDPALLAAAAKALARLAATEAGARALAGSLRALIAAMRRHQDKPEFLRHAAHVLGNIVTTDELRTKASNLGGVQVVVDSMAAHEAHAGVQENCCYALGAVTFGPHAASVSILVAYNGAVRVLGSMRAHPEEEDVLAYATACLSNVCHRNAKNRAMVADLGAPRVLVDTVLTHFNNVPLLLSGFRLLGSLAMHAPSVPGIVRDGGVQSIVAGLTVHSRNADVIGVAVRVLGNLAADLDRDGMAIVAREGAVQAVVDVAHNHGGDASLMVVTLACLFNLAKADFNSAAVVKQGGAAAVAASVRQLAFDADVSLRAAKLLFLVAAAAGNVPRVVQDGGGAALATVLAEHGANDKVVHFCAAAVARISSMEEYAQALGAAGLVDALLAAANAVIRAPGAALDCVAALQALQRCESNSHAMAPAAVVLADALVASYPTDARVVPETAHFLGAMFESGGTVAADCATRAGTVSTCLTAARTNLGSEHAVYECMYALEQMAGASPAAREHARAQNAVGDLQQLKEQAPSVPLKNAIQVAIDALAERAAAPGRKARGFKSAKDIFGEDEEDGAYPEAMEKREVELNEDARNFLTAGQSLMKHSNTARPKQRHVYVTGDLKWLVWKGFNQDYNPEKTPQMRISKIRAVERGRTTPQLQRKTFGKWHAREECAFSVIGRERTADFEAATESEREKWVTAIQEWMAYDKARRKAATRFN